MGISLANIIIILFIVLILFGAGKLPKVMGDLGKGIKSFKEGLKDGENSEIAENKALPEDKNKNEKV